MKCFLSRPNVLSSNPYENLQLRHFLFFYLWSSVTAIEGCVNEQNVRGECLLLLCKNSAPISCGTVVEQRCHFVYHIPLCHHGHLEGNCYCRKIVTCAYWSFYTELVLCSFFLSEAAQTEVLNTQQSRHTRIKWILVSP